MAEPGALHRQLPPSKDSSARAIRSSLAKAASCCPTRPALEWRFPHFPIESPVMRRPLRNQIMLPMAGIMLLAVFVVAGLGAMLSARAAEDRIAAQLSSVARILEDSTFPLTDSVLRQMRALSGAEFIRMSKSGEIIATSGDAKRFLAEIKSVGPSKSVRESVGKRQWMPNQGHFHAVIPLTGRRSENTNDVLHLFYAEEDYRRAWQLAVYPSLAFAALALPIVMLLSAVTARRISGRVTRLQGQVERIAQGNFEQLALGDGDDEIQALGCSVNRMAHMLTRYEQEVRRTERTRTLALLGGGIAHHLRNLATGCNLAIDLHSAECVAGAGCESLDVAKQQLHLIEKYLQQYLHLGKPGVDAPPELVDMAGLIREILPLVEPTARHAGVELNWDHLSSTDCGAVSGNPQLLSLLVMNLLVNAIEAASQGKLQSNSAGRVAIELARRSPVQLALSISDSGPGPSPEVRGHLFEPFVTGHPDGVGLGLAVARDVAHRHGGEIHWRRTGGMTRFDVELPCQKREMQCA